MIFYVTCAMLGFILYPFFYRLNEEPIKEINYKEKKLYFVLITVVFILIAGFRKRNIGIDTTIYYQWFQSFKHISWSRLNLNLLLEPAYQILNWLIANVLGGDFQALLIIEAVVAIVPVSILIYRHSDNPPMSYFFYLAFGFFTFALSGIRQSMAIGFTIIAFLQISKKKPLKFLLFVFIAMLFHQTAIIVFPMYWLRYFKIDVKNTFLFFVMGIVMYIFRAPILAFLNENSKNYYYAMETGGGLQYVFILLMLVSALFMTEQFTKKNSVNSIVFFLVATTAAIFWVLKVNPALFRLYFYFYI